MDSAKFNVRPDMTHQEIEADYVIVGSGAVGMAFADVILSETDATVAIIDRHHKPGGHWNVAYPFVTLHQPSAYYGVPSRELSSGLKDEVGLNKGLYDVASGAEIQAYYDNVMRQTFLPSGRVQYFPLCDYTGDGVFSHTVSNKTYCVTARKKTVDCTYLNTNVPSTHTPNFSISKGVRFCPLNDLPFLQDAPDGYVIIGGGKTGIDACLWLLQHDVDPDKIQWIVSRDAWLLNRKNAQPTMEFFNNSLGAQANQFEAIARADSITDMFDRLEDCGYFLRLDPTIRPSMFHGATITELELEHLRRIKNIVRLGRVQSIGVDKITLKDGELVTGSNILHVDCSASAITNLTMKPIFEGDLITPQTVRSYQPVFSAAFVAHIEATHSDQDTKNELCTVVPLPNHDTDYIKFTAAFMKNQYLWSRDPDLRNWLLNNRLDGFSRVVADMDREDAEKVAIMKKLKDNSFPAMGKLMQFMKEIA